VRAVRGRPLPLQAGEKRTRGVNLTDKFIQTFKGPFFVRKHLEQLLRTVTFVLSPRFNNMDFVTE